MSISFNVQTPMGHAPALTFPKRCVSCANDAATTSRLLIEKNVTKSEGRRQKTRRIQFDVPHCDNCAWATKAVFLAGLIPFALGFLLAGGAAFFAAGIWSAWMGIDDVGRPENANSLVIGAAAGLFVGIAGGFLFELLARLLLLPIMGMMLLRAPLLVPTLFTDADHIAGLTVRPNSDLTSITLTFTNADIAQEFEAANAGHF